MRPVTLREESRGHRRGRTRRPRTTHPGGPHVRLRALPAPLRRTHRRGRTRPARPPRRAAPRPRTPVPPDR
ncbi:hypothetical protein SF12_12750, partial [Streptomyces sp. MBRL 601]